MNPGQAVEIIAGLYTHRIQHNAGLTTAVESPSTMQGCESDLQMHPKYVQESVRLRVAWFLEHLFTYTCSVHRVPGAQREPLLVDGCNFRSLRFNLEHFRMSRENLKPLPTATRKFAEHPSCI